MSSTNSNPTTLGGLIRAKTREDAETLEDIGQEIGKAYTDHGYPIDMALAKVKGTDDQKLSVLHAACKWLIQHKRDSGATEESIDRQRRANLKMLEDYIGKGEVGVY